MEDGGRSTTPLTGAVAIDGSLNVVPLKYAASSHGVEQVCFDLAKERKCGKRHGASEVGAPQQYREM